jgi:bacterioferritin
MKGNKKLIEVLNSLLSDELTAINQYMVHSEMCDGWGYEKLHKIIEKRAIDEMKHADSLIERILFLEGLPNLQDLGRLKVGENVSEMLKADLALEMDGVPLLKEAIEASEKAADYVSRELFEDILEGEEEHIDWLETQLDLIAAVGPQNYQQSMI